MVTVITFQVLHTLCCGYALIWGGKPERIAGILLFSAAVATVLIEAPFDRFNYRDVELATLLVDTALLAALAALALRANRYWPLWMTALHANAVATHLVKFANPSLLPSVYHIAAAIMAIPMATILVIATYRHQTRMVRNGIDAPWSDFSGHWTQPPLATGPQH